MSWRSREVFMPPRPSFRRYRADRGRRPHVDDLQIGADAGGAAVLEGDHGIDVHPVAAGMHRLDDVAVASGDDATPHLAGTGQLRSEEHTSELQSLMRISYAVFCLKKKNKSQTMTAHTH